MNMPFFRLAIALITLAPFGAAAQLVDAGEDALIECDTQSGILSGTVYELDGSAPTGDGIVNEWTTDPAVDLENADTLMPTGEFPLGETKVTLTSTADGGEPESDSVVVTVEDTVPPDPGAKAEPFYLWPPNHSMHEVEVKVRVKDDCSGKDDLDIKLIEATSNEDDNGTGDGNTTNDIQGDNIDTDDRHVLLRAERKGSGNGRVYTLTYSVKEGDGDDSNETDAKAKVYVPHDASDLKDLIGDDDGDRDDMDPICPRPTEAVDELADLFPGPGSVNSDTVCKKVCKAWGKSCKLIGKGSAKCVKGETKALALVAVAECKDPDDRSGSKECRREVKATYREQKTELKQEARDAKEACAGYKEQCSIRCDEHFGASIPESFDD
jgi:hypothetical protein